MITNNMFAEIIRKFPTGIIIIQAQNIVYANDMFLKMIGCNQKIISQKDAFFFVLPAYKNNMISKIKEMLNNDRLHQPGEFLFKAQTDKGNVVWMKMFPSIIEYQDKKSVLANIINISHDQKEKLELTNNCNFYKIFHDSVNDWLWEIDKNGVHTYTNSAVEEFLGYSKEEVLGYSCRRLWTDTGKKMLGKDELVKKLHTGKSWKNKISYFQHKNGEIRISESTGIPFYDENGKLLGYRGVDRDITKRKRTEEDLNTYRTLVENSQDVLAIINPDGTRRFVNKAVKDIAGYDPEELVGKHFTDLVPKKEAKRLKNKWDEMLVSDKKRFKIVHKFKAKSGKILDLEVIGLNYINDKSINGLIASVRDITENKKIERNLHLSREQFSKGFNSNPLMMGISTLEDGKFIKVNESFSHLLGYKKDEIIGKTSVELGILTPDDRKKMKEILLSQKEIYNYEVDVHKKSGEIIKCSAFGSIIEIMGKKRLLSSMQDITEKKQAEKELRKSREMLKAQYKSIPIPTYTWKKSDNDFILVDYNDAAERITNGKIKNFIGKKAIEMYPDRPKIHKELKDCFKNKSNIERELPYKYMSTGKTKYLNVKYAYVPPEYVIVHTEDISERKKAEIKLIETRDRYQKLFDNSIIGFALVEPEGNIVEVNKALPNMLDCEISEIENTNALEWYEFPTDRNKFLKILEEKGRVENFETTLLKNNREKINVIINCSIIRISGKEYYQSTIHDITKLKKAEKKLQEQQKELEKLVQQRTSHLNQEIKDRTAIEKKLQKSLKEKEILIKEINHRVKNNLQILSGIFELYALREKEPVVLKNLKEGINRVKSMALIYDLLHRSEDMSKIELSDYIDKLVKISRKTFQHVGKNINIKKDLEKIYLPISKANPTALIINELLANALQHAFPENFDGEKEIHISTLLNSNNLIEIMVSDNGIGLPDKFNLDNSKTFGFHLIKILVYDQLDGKIKIENENGTCFKIKFAKE